jgi:hypothetical protein
MYLILVEKKLISNNILMILVLKIVEHDIFFVSKNTRLFLYKIFEDYKVFLLNNFLNIFKV